MGNSIQCTNCGAPISYADIRGGIACCPHCGVTFSITNESAFLVPFSGSGTDKAAAIAKRALCEKGSDLYWEPDTQFSHIERIFVPYLWSRGVKLNKNSWKKSNFSTAIPLSKEVNLPFYNFQSLTESRKLFSPEFLAGASVLDIDFKAADLAELRHLFFQKMYPGEIIESLDKDDDIIYLPVYRQYATISGNQEILFLMDGVNHQFLSDYPPRQISNPLIVEEKDRLAKHMKLPLIITSGIVFFAMLRSLFLWIFQGGSVALKGLWQGAVVVAAFLLIWYLPRFVYHKCREARENKRVKQLEQFVSNRMNKLNI